MKLIIAIFFLAIALHGHSQTENSVLFELPGSIDQMYIDQLENLYTVKGDNIRKYLPNGTLQYEISPKRNGQLTLADFSDALRPMLYYRDQGLIQILDNTLSEQGSAVDLFRTFEASIWMACSSIDSHFWFYDTDNFELFRADRNLSKVSRSGNLSQVLGKSVMPEWMLERNSILYVSDPSIGVMMFDLFGTYIKTIPVTGLSRFQVIKSELVFYKSNSICRYPNLDFIEYCDELITKTEFALLGKDRLYLQTDQKVEVRKR